MTYWFRYGTSTAYGSETPDRTVEMAADSSRGVSEPIPITAGTEYHWQVCTQDSEESPPRTVCSKDESLYVGPVSCTTITRNTWVTNDLPNCGIDIGADGITLNLQGHYVRAVRSLGFDDVTIENGTADGVGLSDAADNRVRDMTLTGARPLLVLGDSAGTVIADNVTSSSEEVAFTINASEIQVLRNTVSGAGAGGSDKTAPLVVLGNDNLIKGNTATLNAIGGGRGVGQASILVYGDRNLLRGNIAINGWVDGILVKGEAGGTVLLGNTASDNGHEFSFGDGIKVESPQTSLGDNVTNDNEQLGIRATAGVTDLGGNRASGNGAAAQCTRVVCQR